MFDDSDEDSTIERLEEAGAIEWDGMDENGERIFKVNPVKMRQVYPEMYEYMTNEVSNALEELYTLGLIEVSYTEDLEPRFFISEEGKKLMEKHGYDLKGLDGEL